VLQGEGIVVAKPYCGRAVFDLRPEEQSELTIMRASLESYAAYLAAAKITPAGAERILAAARRFLDVPTSYSDWVDYELGFHRAVWEAARNEWLIRQLTQISVAAVTARILGRRDADVRRLWQDCRTRETETNHQGHQKLARVIVNGKPRDARELMILHVMPEPGAARDEVLLGR
jgi:DNA-binding GntR family transcriptional regulator